MIFWTGAGIGFGCGVVVASLVFLWLIVSANNQRVKSDERLFYFWEKTADHQERQLGALRGIAESIRAKK